MKRPALGFHSNMSLEVSRVRAKQLNSQIEVRRQEERQRSLDEKMAELDANLRAVLPEIFKDEFELQYISSRHDDPQWQERIRKKRGFLMLTSVNAVVVVDTPRLIGPGETTNRGALPIFHAPSQREVPLPVSTQASQP